MKYRLKKQQDTPLSDFGYGEMLGVFEGMAFELDEYFEPVVSNVAVFGDIGPELDEYSARAPVADTKSIFVPGFTKAMKSG